MAAEYVLKEGNENVMLCERGIRTFETAYRFTLDLTAVPVLKELTHLPVDRRPAATPPAGATSSSRCRWPPPRRAPTGSSSRSTPTPEEAICDGPQQLRADGLRRLRRARSSRPPRVAGKVAQRRRRSAAVVQRRGRRRRADRRLGRPRPRASGSARRRRLGPRPGGAATPRSSAARSTRARRRSPRRSPAPTSRSSPRPVGALPARVARRAAPPRRPDCVVTDVGSTKRALVAAIDDARFVGGHPLAGAETAGVAHARADLFDGATWYLTPGARRRGRAASSACTASSPASARARRRSTPTTHDRLMAAVSHLPHVVANVLVAQAARGAGAASASRATGPSFRDATRVAGANPALWAGIYAANRDALADAARRRDRAAGRRPRRAARRRRDARRPGSEAARAQRRRAARGGADRRRRCAELRVVGAQPARRRRRARAGARPRGRQHRRHVALARRPTTRSGEVALWVADADADRARRR